MFKKGLPKKANKKLPKICPCFHRGKHWVKDRKFKFDIEGKPIPRNSKEGTSQVPYNKKEGQILSSPSNPQRPAVLPLIYQPSMVFSFTHKQSLLEYLLEFLGPCPHKPSGFYRADLIWLLKELLFIVE